MLRELVSNNIIVFTSELYAQVTAGVITTPAGVIVIDTMPFPVESRQIARFIRERHNVPVRYIVNTHYHADHTYGTCFFPESKIVGHQLCRMLLETRGQAALEQAQRTSRDMAAIDLILPDVVFDKGELNLHVGGVSLKLIHAPGHSPDSIVCLVEEENILFAADTMMPVPFFADGSWADFVNTLESLQERQIESIVQGHGEVILRGEVQLRIQEDLDYLHCLREHVETIVSKGQGAAAVDNIDIEKCGKSRIALNGIVEDLHRTNSRALYNTLLEEAS